jgi:hypothetical protein
MRKAVGDRLANSAPSDRNMPKLPARIGVDRREVEFSASATKMAARSMLVSEAAAGRDDRGMEPRHLGRQKTPLTAVGPRCTERAGGGARYGDRPPRIRRDARQIAAPGRRLTLARRVAVELARWGIRVDDSAGRSLDTTPPGAFASTSPRPPSPRPGPPPRAPKHLAGLRMSPGPCAARAVAPPRRGPDGVDRRSAGPARQHSARVDMHADRSTAARRG